MIRKRAIIKILYERENNEKLDRKVWKKVVLNLCFVINKKKHIIKDEYNKN